MATLLALLCCIPLSLAAEALALLTLLQPAGSLSLAELVAVLGLHLFAAVCLAEGLRLRYRPEDLGRAGAWRLGLTLSLLLPGFGLLLVSVLILRTPRSIRVKLDELISPMEDRRRQAEAELAAEAQQGRAGVEVEAIGDALKDSDKARRLGAVEALRALQNKQAIELLGKSLQNTVFEVRYHAVEALAGIGKKHSERIARATAVAEREGSPESHRLLGETYFEYAVLEMEEPSIQLHLFRNVVEHLQRSLQPGQPADPAVLAKIGLALEKLGEIEPARRAYRAALQRQPDSFEALLGVARIQFRRGEYEQLRSTCRLLLEVPGRDQQVTPALLLWAEGPEGLQA